MNTTTTAAREAAKNLTIYRAIADHARRAFETLQILPGEYTPAQVADLLKKSRAQFADTIDRREVVRVEVEAFACSFELGDVFALLARLATAYEIPTRDRATFAREAETAETVAEFDVPTTAAAVCKAIAKKDTDRPAVTFAYIDTDRRALVGTDCAVLTVAALPSLLTREGRRPGYLVARGLLKSGRVTIDTNNNATNGAKVAESPEYLHFPRWASVFPDTHDTDALTLTAATRRELCKAITTATAHAFEFGELARRVVVYGENYTARLTVAARREVAAPTAEDPQATRFDYRETTVELPAPLTRSFVLTFDGRDFAKLPTFDTVYISPTGRPAVFTSPATVSLLFTLPTPDNFENVPQADTDRPQWARPVDVLADLLGDLLTPAAETPAEVIATTTDEPQAETITPAPAADTIESEADELAPVAEVVTITTADETPQADTIESETPADVTAAPAADDITTTSEAENVAENVENAPAPAADPLTPAEAVSEAENERETPQADELAPAPVAAALLLLARADLRDACKAIATAKPDKATDRDHRAASDARRLLTREGLTVTDYKVKTADGLTLARFMYSYGKKSRRTLCAPLLKITAEFATAETLADEWADLLAAAASETIESEAETLSPVSGSDAPAETITPAPAADTIESEADELAPVAEVVTITTETPQADTIEAPAAEVVSESETPAAVWALADELPTADGLTPDTVTVADLLPVFVAVSVERAAAPADTPQADREAESEAENEREIRRALLLTIARRARRLAVAVAAAVTTLLLLTLTPDRPTTGIAATAAAGLLAPVDTDTVSETPADVLTITPDTIESDPQTDTLPVAVFEPVSVEISAAPAADRPTPRKRHHARENKRESHQHATADTIASEADTLTVADLLTLTPDTLTADTVAAAPADTITTAAPAAGTPDTIESERESETPAEVTATGETANPDPVSVEGETADPDPVTADPAPVTIDPAPVIIIGTAGPIWLSTL